MRPKQGISSPLRGPLSTTYGSETSGLCSTSIRERLLASQIRRKAACRQSPIRPLKYKHREPSPTNFVCVVCAKLPTVGVGSGHQDGDLSPGLFLWVTSAAISLTVDDLQSIIRWPYSQYLFYEPGRKKRSHALDRSTITYEVNVQDTKTEIVSDSPSARRIDQQDVQPCDTSSNRSGCRSQ